MRKSKWAPSFPNFRGGFFFKIFELPPPSSCLGSCCSDCSLDCLCTVSLLVVVVVVLEDKGVGATTSPSGLDGGFNIKI